MTITLAVAPRLEGSKNNKEVIKAVVYGPKFATTPITIDKKEFDKTFKAAGESTIVSLTGLKETVEVLIKEVSFAPLKGGITHVDFYALNMSEEITAHTPLHFIGEAPATKLGAVLNKVLHEVEMTCKPKDLPSHIDVDLSLLVNIEDKIQVSDIVAPKGVVINTAADVIIVIAEAVKEETVSDEMPVVIADIPVEQKGKTEEEA